MASRYSVLLEDTPYVIDEIEKIERTRTVLAIAITAKVEGHTQEMIGQRGQLPGPIGPIAANTVQKYERLACAGDVHGQAWRGSREAGMSIHMTKSLHGLGYRGSIQTLACS